MSDPKSFTKTPQGVSSFEKNLETLMERFPIFSLFVSQLSSKNPRSIQKQSLQIDLKNIQILLVYGIDIAIWSQVQPWLQESPAHQLVFVEKKLSSVSRVLSCKENIFKNPQVHLEMLLDKDIDRLATELAEKFSNTKIEVITTAKHQTKEFNSFRSAVLKKSILFEAVLKESIFSEKIFANFSQNIRQLSSSFSVEKWKNRFKGVPAIICGAGPSLEKSIPVLQKLYEQAVVLAGGSAIAALSRSKTPFHFGVVCDPNLEEYERLKQVPLSKQPLLYSLRVHSKVLQATTGIKGWIPTSSGGALETWFLDKHPSSVQIDKDLGVEALSVSTLNVALAQFWGCNPIIFCGMDLAYTDGKRYAKGVEAQNIEMTNRLQRFDIHKEPIETNTLWDMESNVISDFAKKHPETMFFNATEGGLGFEGISNRSLEEISLKHLRRSFGIFSKIQEASREKPPCSSEKIEKILKELSSKISLCLEKVELLLQELAKMEQLSKATGKYVLTKMELEEEGVYQDLFALHSYHMKKYMQYHEGSYIQDPKQKQIEVLQRLQKTLQSYLRLYS